MDATLTTPPAPPPSQDRPLKHSVILGTFCLGFGLLIALTDQVTVDERRMKIAVTTPRPARIVVEMVKWLDEHGVELADIRIKRPSLEDALIELTGKSLRE